MQAEVLACVMSNWEARAPCATFMQSAQNLLLSYPSLAERCQARLLLTETLVEYGCLDEFSSPLLQSYIMHAAESTTIDVSETIGTMVKYHCNLNIEIVALFLRMRARHLQSAQLRSSALLSAAKNGQSAPNSDECHGWKRLGFRDQDLMPRLVMSMLSVLGTSNPEPKGRAVKALNKICTHPWLCLQLFKGVVERPHLAEKMRAIIGGIPSFSEFFQVIDYVNVVRWLHKLDDRSRFENLACAICVGAPPNSAILDKWPRLELPWGVRPPEAVSKPINLTIANLLKLMPVFLDSLRDGSLLQSSEDTLNALENCMHLSNQTYHALYGVMFISGWNHIKRLTFDTPHEDPLLDIRKLAFVVTRTPQLIAAIEQRRGNPHDGLVWMAVKFLNSMVSNSTSGSAAHSGISEDGDSIRDHANTTSSDGSLRIIRQIARTCALLGLIDSQQVMQEVPGLLLDMSEFELWLSAETVGNSAEEVVLNLRNMAGAPAEEPFDKVFLNLIWRFPGYCSTLVKLVLDLVPHGRLFSVDHWATVLEITKLLRQQDFVQLCHAMDLGRDVVLALIRTTDFLGRLSHEDERTVQAFGACFERLCFVWEVYMISPARHILEEFLQINSEEFPFPDLAAWLIAIPTLTAPPHELLPPEGQTVHPVIHSLVESLKHQPQIDGLRQIVRSHNLTPLNMMSALTPLVSHWLDQSQTISEHFDTSFRVLLQSFDYICAGYLIWFRGQSHSFDLLGQDKHRSGAVNLCYELLKRLGNTLVNHKKNDSPQQPSMAHFCAFQFHLRCPGFANFDHGYSRLRQRVHGVMTKPCYWSKGTAEFFITLSIYNSVSFAADAQAFWLELLKSPKEVDQDQVCHLGLLPIQPTALRSVLDALLPGSCEIPKTPQEAYETASKLVVMLVFRIEPEARSMEISWSELVRGFFLQHLNFLTAKLQLTTKLQAAAQRYPLATTMISINSNTTNERDASVLFSVYLLLMAARVPNLGLREFVPVVAFAAVAAGCTGELALSLFDARQGKDHAVLDELLLFCAHMRNAAD